jgi:hypothetical protein
VEFSSTWIYDLKWLSGAQLDFKLFSIDAQANIFPPFGHIYFSRFYGSLLGRASFFGKQAKAVTGGRQFTASAGLNLGIEFKIVPVSVLPLTFNLGGEVLYKFNDWQTYNNDLTKYLYAGVLFNVSY